MGLPRFIATYDSTQRTPSVWTRKAPGAPWERKSLPFQWASSDRVFSIHVAGHDAAPVRSSPLTPLYRGGNAGLEVVSDCPTVVAASMGQTDLDRETLVLEQIFGFAPNTRTLFRGVDRIEERDDGLRGHPDRAEPFEELLDIIASACRSGLWLELTGGFDSQMVLALSIIAEVKPLAAFTIGEQGSFDVDEASRVGRLLGIEHIRVPLSNDETRISNEIQRSLIDSRFGLNPVEIAHIYASLDAIDENRRGQISGVGGEACGGFYGIGLPFGLDDRAQRITRSYAAKHLSEALQCFGRVACRDSLKNFRDWWLGSRMDGDSFYIRGRLANWAAPVLVSSSERYESVNPLMTDAYRSWISAMPGRGRERQRNAFRKMAERSPIIASLTPNQSRPSGVDRCRAVLRKAVAATGLRSRKPSVDWVRNAKIAIREYGPERMRELALEFGCTPSCARDVTSAVPYTARLVGLLVKFDAARKQAERERAMLPRELSERTRCA